VCHEHHEAAGLDPDGADEDAGMGVYADADGVLEGGGVGEDHDRVWMKEDVQDV